MSHELQLQPRQRLDCSPPKCGSWVLVDSLFALMSYVCGRRPSPKEVITVKSEFFDGVLACAPRSRNCAAAAALTASTEKLRSFIMSMIGSDQDSGPQSLCTLPFLVGKLKTMSPPNNSTAFSNRCLDDTSFRSFIRTNLHRNDGNCYCFLESCVGVWRHSLCQWIQLRLAPD